MELTTRITNTLYNRMLSLVLVWAVLAAVGVVGSLPVHLGQ